MERRKTAGHFGGSDVSSKETIYAGDCPEHSKPGVTPHPGCPICFPDKTVPELNEAYRASKEHIRQVPQMIADCIASLETGLEMPRDRLVEMLDWCVEEMRRQDIEIEQLREALRGFMDFQVSADAEGKKYERLADIARDYCALKRNARSTLAEQGTAVETPAIEFEHCVFRGDPPAPFNDWNTWASSRPKRGVEIRAVETTAKCSGCGAAWPSCVCPAADEVAEKAGAQQPENGNGKP